MRINNENDDDADNNDTKTDRDINDKKTEKKKQSRGGHLGSLVALAWHTPRAAKSTSSDESD